MLTVGFSVGNGAREKGDRSLGEAEFYGGAGWHLESHAGGRDLLWAFQFSSSVGPGHWRTGAVLREIFPGGLRKALITALGNHTTDLTTSSEDGGTGPFRYVGDDLRLGHRWKGGQWNRGGRASQGNRRSATVTFQESAGSDGGVPESAGKGETLLPAEPAERPGSREKARDQKSWRGSGSLAKRLTAM